MELRLTQLNSLQLFQVLRYGSIFLTSIFVSNLLGNKLLVGQYETMLLYGNSFFFFWLSGITANLFPIRSSLHGKEREILFYNAFILISVLSLLFSGLVVGFSWIDTTVTDKPLFALYAAYIFINAPTYLVEFVFLLEKRFTGVIIYGVLIFSAQVLVSTLPLLFGYSLYETVMGLMFLSIAKYLFLLKVLRQYSTASVDLKLLKQILMISAPLVFSLLLSGSIEYINGFIIKGNFSMEAFADYRIGAREFPLFLIMCNSMSNVMSGRLAETQRDGDLQKGLAELKEKTNKLMHLLFPLGIIFILFSKNIFHFLYPAFDRSYIIFNFYVLLLISRLVFPQTILLGLRQNKSIAWASVIEILVNIILANILLKFMSIQGVATAMVVAFIAEKIFLISACKSKGINYLELIPGKTYLLYSTILLIVFFLSTFSLI